MEDKNTIQVINVTGLGLSGKSAVTDLIGCFDGVWSPDNSFEFDFFRLHDGLFDFMDLLENEVSQGRLDIGFKKILLIAYRMGVDPSIFDLKGNFYSSSQRYNKFFNKNFLNETNNFLMSLVKDSYKAHWPYQRLIQSNLQTFIEKFLYRINLGFLTKKNIYILNRENLNKKFNSYFMTLLKNLDSNSHTFAFNNLSEPYNLKKLFSWVNNVKNITVLRDPRDIYASAKIKNNSKDSFIGFEDVNVFIERYKNNASSVFRGKADRNLIINFEEFINDHENEKKRIINFLNFENLNFIESSKFNLSESSKNVFVWKNYPELKKDILKIEKDLKGYLS